MIVKKKNTYMTISHGDSRSLSNQYVVSRNSCSRFDNTIVTQLVVRCIGKGHPVFDRILLEIRLLDLLGSFIPRRICRFCRICSVKRMPEQPWNQKTSIFSWILMYKNFIVLYYFSRRFGKLLIFNLICFINLWIILFRYSTASFSHLFSFRKLFLLVFVNIINQ